MEAVTDKLIGKLIAKLEEFKRRDNTVVLLLDDNGPDKDAVAIKGHNVVGGKSRSTI